MGVIVMEPLRGGNLAIPNTPPAVKDIWDEAEQKRTPAEWALRWIWDYPEVTVVLSGMNKESHIAKNLAIAEDAMPDSLTESERDIVERAAHKYRKLMKVGCTGCGYCMPCPMSVMIPDIFEMYNKMHMSGNEAEAKLMYAARLSGQFSSREPEYVSQCVECGQCVDKCPQQLEIPQFLASAAEQLEGPDLDEQIAMAKTMFTGETS